MRLAILAALALGACSSPPPPPRAAGTHPTIVSLNPCTDAILAEVTAPGQLLAVSPYSRDPAQSSMDVALARRLPVAASVEEVAVLRPDLVVSSSFDGPASVAAYRRLGLAYEAVPIASTVADSIAQVRRLAALAGHFDKGEALVRRIEASQSALPLDAPVPAIVWEGGGMVAGGDTLVAELMRRAGFADAASARGLRQADVLPLEAMLADPPRAMLVAGSARAQEDRMLSHPALAALNNTKRFRLDPALLYCGGPTIPRLSARLQAIRRAL
jgi:iron complex transport system substrate-binding protein